jgi:hypothetical protein
MTRVVDAAGAIAARGYPPGARAEVHLQLDDRVAPWNDGRFVLRVEGGEGKLIPGGTGDVHLSVNGLASLYTGWATAAVLSGAGTCAHALMRDLGLLDAALAGPRPYLFGTPANVNQAPSCEIGGRGRQAAILSTAHRSQRRSAARSLTSTSQRCPRTGRRPSARRELVELRAHGGQRGEIG